MCLSIELMLISVNKKIFQPFNENPWMDFVSTLLAKVVVGGYFLLNFQRYDWNLRNEIL